MAEWKATPEQQAAAQDRGGALLVAAAAGSGKTKVLVDRLMGYLTDPDDPADLDEFLIITYTRAAAAELRGKIAARLGEMLAEDPDNKHLQRQLTRVYLAQISTVHAFCQTVLRQYAAEADLPADFRVADEQQAAALRAEALQDTLAELCRSQREPRLCRHDRYSRLRPRRPPSACPCRGELRRHALPGRPRGLDAPLPAGL